MMRAEIKAVYKSALLAQGGPLSFVYFTDILLGEKPSGHTGLVTDDDSSHAAFVDQADSLKSGGDDRSLSGWPR